jgi:hypothetical protein
MSGLHIGSDLMLANQEAARACRAWMLATGLYTEMDVLRGAESGLVPAPGLDDYLALADDLYIWMPQVLAKVGAERLSVCADDLAAIRPYEAKIEESRSVGFNNRNPAVYVDELGDDDVSTFLCAINEVGNANG